MIKRVRMSNDFYLHIVFIYLLVPLPPTSKSDQKYVQFEEEK